MSSVFPRVCENVRRKIGPFRALVLVGRDGRILADAIDDPTLDPEILLEFATLLRIARRTAEDTQTGSLSEICWTSGKATVLMRRVWGESFLMLIGDPDLRIGMARYALRRAAGQLLPQFEGAVQ